MPSKKNIEEPFPVSSISGGYVRNPSSAQNLARTRDESEAIGKTEMEGYRRPRPVSGYVPNCSSSSVSASRSPSLSTSRESMEIICELSDLLQTGLSQDALVALVDLLECGVSPEAVAAAVLEIRREVSGGVTTSGVGG